MDDDDDDGESSIKTDNENINPLYYLIPTS
jgi:hypothetical protein